MAAAKHLLSKSTFIRGVQCLKSLYLNKHRPFLRDRLSPEQLARFNRGHAVGNLAWDLFPGGISCAPPHPSQSMRSVEKTTALISNRENVIYEAAFLHDDVLIFLDILVRTATGWQAYEVKSSAAISETYLQDAALQYYVIRGNGIIPVQMNLVYLNPGYLLEGALDPGKLFLIKDVTSEAEQLLPWVEQQLSIEKETLRLEKSPGTGIGSRCYTPYPCDFRGHCWKNRDLQVFNLPALPLKQRLALLDRGITRIADIPPEELTARETEALSAHRAGSEFTDKAFLMQFFGRKNDTKTGFVKFLYTRKAVPSITGTKPYQLLIFGLAFQDKNGHEWIKTAPPDSDPRLFTGPLLNEICKAYSSVYYFDNAFIPSSLQEAGLTDQDAACFVNLGEIFTGLYYYNPVISTLDDPVQLASDLGLDANKSAVLSDPMIGVHYLKQSAGSLLPDHTKLQEAGMRGVNAVKLLFEFLYIRS